MGLNLCVLGESPPGGPGVIQAPGRTIPAVGKQRLPSWQVYLRIGFVSLMFWIPGIAALHELFTKDWLEALLGVSNN